MKNKMMINLKDTSDEDFPYLRGVMGEGWTNDVEQAYLFTPFSAYFYKFLLRFTEGLKLEVVKRVVFY